MPSNNNFQISPVIDQTTGIKDYTRNSEGYQAGSGLDTIVKGVSDIFSMAVKGTDQFIKNKTTEDIQTQVDAARDEAIVQRKAAVNLNDSDVPQALKQQAKELQNIDTAKQQGKLRDSHYWAKMDLIARDMRARYPGYREHIDNTISGLLGTTPANALVKALDHEADKVIKTDDEAKFIRNFVKENLEYLPDDAIKAANSGDRSSWNVSQLMITAAQGQRRKANVSQAKAELELVSKQGDVSKENLRTVHNLEVHDAFAKSMDKFDPILNKITTDLQADRANNGGFNTPEMIQRAQLALAQAKEEAQRSFVKISADQRYRLLPSEDQRKNTENFSKIFDSISESITSGTLTHTANSVKAIKENADLQAQGIDQIAADSALFRALGQTADKYLPATPDVGRLSAAQELVRRRALTRIAGGEDAARVASDAKRANLPDKVIVDVYRRARELLKTNEVPDAVWTKTFESLYGKDGNPDRLLSQGKNNNDTKAIFEQWSSPSMYVAIKNRSKNDPTILNNYKTWVINGAQTVFNRELSDIRETTQQGQLVKVEWQNNRFVAVPNTEATSKVLDPSTLNAVAQAWNTGRLNGLNSVVKNLEPVWQEQGADVKANSLKLLGLTMERLDTDKESSLQAFRGLIERPQIKAPTVEGAQFGEKNITEIIKQTFKNIDEKETRRLAKEIWDKMPKAQGPRITGGRESTNVEITNSLALGAGRFARPDLNGGVSPEPVAKPEDFGLSSPIEDKPVAPLKPTS